MIHSTWYWKGSSVSAGIRTPDQWITKQLSTTELSDLLMNGRKSSIYQVSNSLFTNQSSIRNCHKMTICEQYRAKCCVQTAATLTLASTDVFLIKMWQESYNRMESWVFEKNIFFVGKWVASKNSHILLCMTLSLYMWKITLFIWWTNEILTGTQLRLPTVPIIIIVIIIIIIIIIFLELTNLRCFK